MKSRGSLAVLLVAVLLVLASLAASAVAVTGPGTGGDTGSSTTGNAVTVTPAGTYTISGSTVLDPDTSTMTIDCTAVVISGTSEEDGTGSATLTFGSCSASLFLACAITPVNLVVTIVEAGGVDTLTGTSTVSAEITCAGVIDCTVATTPMTTLIDTDGFTRKPNVGGTTGTFATKVTGTVTAGDEPTGTITGTFITDGTALCTGALSGIGTVDAAGDVPRGTGNDMTITI